MKLQYILLIACWILCIIGSVKGYYSDDAVVLSAMLLIIGSMIMNKEEK